MALNDTNTQQQLMVTSLNAISGFIQARNERRAADYIAKQLERNAQARYAQGTREAYEIQRQGRIMASDARAAMAFSGGGTTDVGAIDQLARIKSDTDYNAMSAVFGASSEAGGLLNKASAIKAEAKLKANEKRIKTVSTVLSDSVKIRENW